MLFQFLMGLKTVGIVITEKWSVLDHITKLIMDQILFISHFHNSLRFVTISISQILTKGTFFKCVSIWCAHKQYHASSKSSHLFQVTFSQSKLVKVTFFHFSIDVVLCGPLLIITVTYNC